MAHTTCSYVDPTEFLRARAQRLRAAMPDVLYQIGQLLAPFYFDAAKDYMTPSHKYILSFTIRKEVWDKIWPRTPLRHVRDMHNGTFVACATYPEESFSFEYANDLIDKVIAAHNECARHEAWMADLRRMYVGMWGAPAQ